MAPCEAEQDRFDLPGEWTPSLLLALVHERKHEGLLDRIVQRFSELPDLALARVWVIRPTPNDRRIRMRSSESVRDFGHHERIELCWIRFADSSLNPAEGQALLQLSERSRFRVASAVGGAVETSDSGAGEYQIGEVQTRS